MTRRARTAPLSRPGEPVEAGGLPGGGWDLMTASEALRLLLFRDAAEKAAGDAGRREELGTTIPASPNRGRPIEHFATRRGMFAFIDEELDG